jgi:hypothetical protein
MTKYTIAAALAALVSANAATDHVYGGLAQGNPDLSVPHTSTDVLGVQPGVGTSFDVYYGLAQGNSSLFQAREWTGESGDLPNVYEGFRASPDLSY